MSKHTCPCSGAVFYPDFPRTRRTFPDMLFQRLLDMIPVENPVSPCNPTALWNFLLLFWNHVPNATLPFQLYPTPLWGHPYPTPYWGTLNPTPYWATLTTPITRPLNVPVQAQEPVMI
ncbi:hypothetical protein FQN60_006790 [Etheostoma spectabile]|uniref:Uncharacterized protein n=1 Tax=Etheostoma spectabile TaxID=54343 RepID=A0A5J5CD88_9PERO|nr:hypothetical protein FQN60_006790 [Etheostoma spectabile]